MYKSLLTISILFAFDMLFAQYNPLVSDFRISNDNYEATYIQTQPFLFENNNKEFIVAWEDYRKGEVSYFAQRFDSLGNKIGNNFQTISNTEICFNNNSDFINIKQQHTQNYLSDGGTTQFYFSLFDKNNRQIKEETFLGFVSIPWCGTGYFGYGTKTCQTQNGYLFGLLDNTKFSLKKIDKDGNNIETLGFVDTVNTKPNLYFDLASKNGYNLLTLLQATNYEGIVTSVGGTNKNHTEENDTTILKCIVYNDKDTSNIIQFNVAEFTGQGIYDFLPDKNLFETIATEDSSFLIADFLSNKFILTYRKFNYSGKRVTQDSSIETLDTLNTLHPEDYDITKLAVSHLKNSFILHVVLDSAITKYYHKLFVFNKRGNYIKTISYTENIRPNDIGTQFNISDSKYFTAKNSKHDIYLFKKNLNNIIDSLKINDDKIGSNDIKPNVVPVNNKRFFVSWKNEKGVFGKFVNNNGSTEQSQIKLKGEKSIFFYNENSTPFTQNLCVNFWKRNLDNNNEIAGFTIYNSDWNIVKEDTFRTGNNINFDVKKISDRLFVINSGDNKKIKLSLYNSNGALVKEKLLQVTDYAVAPKVFRNDENSFWIKWYDNLQLYNNELKPLTEIYKNRGDHYLGNEKFLYIHQKPASPVNKLVGTILNAQGDTLAEEINFDELFSLNYNYDYDYKIIRANNNEFLLLFPFTDLQNSQKRELYWKLYNSNSGEAIISKKKLNANSLLKAKDITAAISNEKIFFVWSDLREGNNGYDIYGNIYNINEITDVKEIKNNKIPEKIELFQNYPNPFNPTTTIQYKIPRSREVRGVLKKERRETTNSLSAFGVRTTVQLKVYNVLGKEITTLVNKHQNPGTYKITFDATNLSSGVYYYQLKVGDFVKTRKMILLR